MQVWQDEEIARGEPRFRDRTDAGAVLAQHLARFRQADAVVLGIPRGGVVVAAEVARQLGNYCADFTQTADDEVQDLLTQARGEPLAAVTGPRR